MQFTYPAVFYYDEEYSDYAVEFSDICIYTEGETMEDAYQNAQKFLLAYLETCEELHIAPNEPNKYENTLKLHPNGKVMLVTVDYESKKKHGKDEPMLEKQFSTLEDDIVEDIKEGFEEGDNPVLAKYIKDSILNKKPKDDDGDGDDFGLPEVE